MAARITGTGRYLPELVVTNDDLAKFLDTSDEWIRTRSGIVTRHVSEGETTSEMGAKAASAAIAKSGLTPDDIDVVICATLTPDSCVPMVASNIKRLLGIQNAATFDMNGNCSGFVYATIVADSLMKTCGYRHALVIGADTNSRVLDWTDRSTCVLFGDGAGAIVISADGERGVIGSFMNCIIDSEDALTCPNPLRKTPFAANERTEGTTIAMQGAKVMRFAVRAAVAAMKDVLEKSGVSADDVKYVVPHQANRRIIDAIAASTSIDSDKFYVNIDRFANTSSGTIPIALDEMVEGGLLNRGDLVFLVAFGGGLSSSATLLEW